jgi:hypothetical protein
LLEISTGPNTPIVFQRAPNALNLRSNFLAKFNQHFLDKGEKVFDVMLEEHPVTYFNALVQLAKVMKIEVGEAGAFDGRPRPRVEALAALEARAGPQARALFERFLKQIDQLEAAKAEGSEQYERAAAERTERGERAVTIDGEVRTERAATAEGSEQSERAVLNESSASQERPKRRKPLKSLG